MQFEAFVKPLALIICPLTMSRHRAKVTRELLATASRYALNPMERSSCVRTDNIRHNASSLSIIQAVAHMLPNARNIAYFDSAFHQTLPAHIRTYAIDQKVAARNKLRKYGFHGISYSFILRTVASYLQKPASSTNLIALHLGSGASACAIRQGQSHDTSMGLTPLAGLPGATRSGSVDPSLVFHYTHDAGRLAPRASKDLHITAAEHILNKQSGWKALAGTTDFGVISAKALDERDPDHERCRLALDVFVDRVLGFVGAYFVALGGQCDALVFAGGIGEKGALLRKRVVDGVKCLGFELVGSASLVWV